MTPHSESQLADEISRFIQDYSEIDELEVLSVDFAGRFFGKRYPMSKLMSFARDGLAFPMSLFIQSGLGNALQSIHYGSEDGDPDAHFRLIPGTLAANDWGLKPRAQIMASTLQSGKPTFFEPRNILDKVLKLYEGRNWHPVVAFELEFYLFAGERNTEQLVQLVQNPKTGRIDTPSVLSNTRISDFELILDDIISACNQQAIETGAISAEMGAGQFEINFNHHHDVLRAADETCLFKRTVIEVAKKHGVLASFMAKPLLEQPGNGLHMHISIEDGKGHNVFSDDGKPHQRLMHAIGGLLDTMPAAMSFLAPNINSYRRFTGGNCAPLGLNWGHENRSVAYRIPAVINDAWRVENRVPGADANPYLAMAISLASMWHGLEQQSDPGKPCERTVTNNDHSTLPANLQSALWLTRNSEPLIKCLGVDFIELYCDHREADTLMFEEFISPREYDWYL